jgi:N-acetylmuramoyl-L-alanine amidase
MENVDIYPTFLLALCVWREARGEAIEGKVAVACSIRNRVLQPRWWGRDYVGVILCRLQYSSFNPSDPNVGKFPAVSDPSWQDCLMTAIAVYGGTQADTSGDADSYFDRSLDDNPPKWAASATHTCDIGKLHFYKTI